jgi:hypothetical protein
MPDALRSDQIEDLSSLIANPKHMMLHEPSCGKTPTICVMQWYLWSELGVGTVWIMPKTLLGKNRDELLRFTPFLRQQVVIVEKEDQIKPGPVVFLMTAERHRRSWRKLPENVRAIHVDELHKMYKNWESSRTAELRDHIRKLDRTGKCWFVPMTGTLINGRIETAFPAVHLIEPRYYGSWEAFKAYHIVTDDFSGARLGTRNEAKLGAILKRHSCFRSFEEVHGKEAKVIFTETVDMHRPAGDLRQAGGGRPRRARAVLHRRHPARREADPCPADHGAPQPVPRPARSRWQDDRRHLPR